MFDVFLLMRKEEESAGLTFDPDTGLYLRRAEVVQEQGAGCLDRCLELAKIAPSYTFPSIGM